MIIIRHFIIFILTIFAFMPVLLCANIAYLKAQEKNKKLEQLLDVKSRLEKVDLNLESMINEKDKLLTLASGGVSPDEVHSRVMASFSASGIKIIDVSTQGQSTSASGVIYKTTVRGFGGLKSAKEALWNLGDIGPSVRLVGFRGQYDSSLKSMVWSYPVFIIGKPPGSVHSEKVEK